MIKGTFQLDFALAVPVDNGRLDIFLSYCISAGIGQPTYHDGGIYSIPPFKTVSFFFLKKFTFFIISIQQNQFKIYEDTLDARKRQKRNGLITRRKFYRLFADNLRE